MRVTTTAMAPKLAAMGYGGIELYSGQLTAVDPNVFLDVLGAAAMTAYPDYQSSSDRVIPVFLATPRA